MAPEAANMPMDWPISQLLGFDSLRIEYAIQDFDPPPNDRLQNQQGAPRSPRSDDASQFSDDSSEPGASYSPENFDMTTEELEDLCEMRDQNRHNRLVLLWEWGTMEEIEDAMGGDDGDDMMTDDHVADSEDEDPPCTYWYEQGPSSVPSTPPLDPLWHERPQQALEDLDPQRSFASSSDGTETPVSPDDPQDGSRHPNRVEDRPGAEYDAEAMEDVQITQSAPPRSECRLLRRQRMQTRAAERADALFNELQQHLEDFQQLEKKLNMSWEAWYEYADIEAIAEMYDHVDLCGKVFRDSTWRTLCATLWETKIPPGVRQVLLHCIEFIERRDQLLIDISTARARARRDRNFELPILDGHTSRAVGHFGFEVDEQDTTGHACNIGSFCDLGTTQRIGGAFASVQDEQDYLRVNLHIRIIRLKQAKADQHPSDKSISSAFMCWALESLAHIQRSAASVQPADEDVKYSGKNVWQRFKILWLEEIEEALESHEEKLLWRGTLFMLRIHFITGEEWTVWEW